MELDEITNQHIIDNSDSIVSASKQYAEGAITEEELKNYVIVQVLTVVTNLVERQK